MGSSEEIVSDDSDVGEMLQDTGDIHLPLSRFNDGHNGDDEDDQCRPHLKPSPSTTAAVDTHHGTTLPDDPSHHCTGDITTQLAATLPKGPRHHTDPLGNNRGHWERFPMGDACVQFVDGEGNTRSAGPKSATLSETHCDDRSLHEAPIWKEQECRGMSPTRAECLVREEGKFSMDATNGQMGADLLNANGSFLPASQACDTHAALFGPNNIKETSDTPDGIVGPSTILDVTTQTPPPLSQYICESPVTHNAASGNGWRVYSRKKGCRKQQAQIKGMEASTGTARPMLSHQKLSEEVETAPTCSKPNTSTEHAQEAISQWELAKVLGVTAAIDPDIIINKIGEMEDRDRKEADAMGNIIIPP